MTEEALKEIPEFIYGIQYYRAPTPLKNEWEEDIRNIRKIGFNTIKIWVQWRKHERIHGKFEFDDIDRIIDLCEESGLFVVINFILETAPDWLYKLYHCERINQSGIRIPPLSMGSKYIGGWYPCFDNPDVIREGSNFIKECVRRYKNRENIIVWDIYNEPRNYIPDCSCRYTLRKYRDWLKGKYKTIENLNDTFGKAWGSWDGIRIPSGTRDYAETYLWRIWAMHITPERVRWMSKAVKEIDKRRPVMSHVGTASLVQDVLTDTSNDWLNSKIVDFYGASLHFYTGEFKGMSSIENMAIFSEKKGKYNFFIINMIADWTRSVSTYFWISELYANKWYWSVRDFSADDICFWIWSVISSGTKGILIWQYKPERLGDELLASGLVELDGKETSRSKEVNRIGKIIQKNKDVFNNFIPEKSDIALVYDHRSDLLSRLDETTITPGGYNNFGTTKYLYKESLKGSYFLFWRNNISVDWISIQDIERIKNYKMVYLPSPLVIDNKTAEVLINYVRDGGFLISEASIGLFTEKTWLSPIVPGCNLHELFSCTEEKRIISDEPDHVIFKNMLIRGSKIRSYLKPNRAKVLAYWKNTKQPAITINEYGNGKAILSGNNLGAAYLNTHDSKIHSFLHLIIKEANISQKVKFQGGKGLILTRILNYQEKKALFIFNYEDFDQKINIIKPGLENILNLTVDNVIIKNNTIYLSPRSVGIIIGEVRYGRE